MRWARTARQTGQGGPRRRTARYHECSIRIPRDDARCSFPPGGCRTRLLENVMSFLPRTDADLLAWATAFSDQISADAASFGVPAGTATDLAAAVTAYADAFAEASNESTRTKG